MITVTQTQIDLANAMIIKLRAKSKRPNRLTLLVAAATAGQQINA